METTTMVPQITLVVSHVRTRRTKTYPRCRFRGLLITSLRNHWKIFNLLHRRRLLLIIQDVQDILQILYKVVNLEVRMNLSTCQRGQQLIPRYTSLSSTISILLEMS